MCHKLRNIPFDPEKNQQRILPGNWGEIFNRNSFVQMCTTVTQCELSIYFQKYNNIRIFNRNIFKILIEIFFHKFTGNIFNRNSFVQMCTTVTQCELSIYTFRNIIPPEKCKILCLKMYTFRVCLVCIGSANAIASGP